MINFFKGISSESNDTQASIQEAEHSLQECKLSLQEAASGTRDAAYSLIGDLKSTIENREKKYQLLVESIQDGMYILCDKKFIFANKALCELIGLPRVKIIGRTLKEVVDIKEHYSEIIAVTEEGHREYTIKYAMKETGQHKIVTVWETLSYDTAFIAEISNNVNQIEDHECAIAIGTVKDVTEVIEQERMLRAFSSAINNSSDIIMVVSNHGNIMFVNTAFEETYSYTLKEVSGKNPNILRSGIHSDDFYKRMWATLLNGQEWRGVIFNKTKDNRIVEDDTKIIPFMNGTLTPLFFMAVKKIRRIYTSIEDADLLNWPRGNPDKP